VAFTLFERVRLLLPPQMVGTFTTPAGFAFAADREVDPPRFEPHLSVTHGGFTTGVSPDRTHTGWLPSACRAVMSWFSPSHQDARSAGRTRTYVR
jgi:hypothetical protein